MTPASGFPPYARAVAPVALVAFSSKTIHNNVMKSNPPKVEKAENLRLAKAATKRRAFEMLRDGASYRQIEKETGISRGTLSRWKRSNAYNVWCAEMSSPLMAEARAAAKMPIPEMGRIPKDEPRGRAEVRGKFLFAVKLGGLQWAQNYSGCTDKECAEFLRDVEVMAADSKARLTMLGVLRQIALDPETPKALRAKTSVDYLKIIDAGMGTSPLIHIDARGQVPGAPSDHIRVMLESIMDEAPHPKFVLDAELQEYDSDEP